MTSGSYTLYEDLQAEVEIPQRGIYSRTVSSDDAVEVVLFAMAAGELLSEHSSSRPAIVHVLSGEGELTVAGDHHIMRAGSWVRMVPRTSHTLVANTGLVFALSLLPPVG